jgi:hypothetical protein
MAKKTWIEIALNGAWTRRVQPRIPVTGGRNRARGGCMRESRATAADVRAALKT